MHICRPLTWYSILSQYKMAPQNHFDRIAHLRHFIDYQYLAYNRFPVKLEVGFHRLANRVAGIINAESTGVGPEERHPNREIVLFFFDDDSFSGLQAVEHATSYHRIGSSIVLFEIHGSGMENPSILAGSASGDCDFALGENSVFEFLKGLAAFLLKYCASTSFTDCAGDPASQAYRCVG